MMERRRALDGSLPAAHHAQPRAPLELPDRRRRSPSCSAARATQAVVDDDGASPACCATWPATSSSASASCRSSPTRPARSAWTRCSASSRSTRRRARSTSRSTTTCCSPTPRRADGQILEEGITEAGVDGQLHRRRHRLRHPRRADGAVLHLLFDVRLPAGRRPHLAGGRRPHARASCSAPPPGAPRCSARACSTRTATALVLASTVPAVPGLRPGVRLRGGGDRAGTACTACTATDAEPDADVFYYLTLYNENYAMPPMPERRRARRTIVRGPVPLGGGARRARRQRATMLFSGSAQGAAREAAAELAEHYDVGAELWSATSYKALREEALAVERWNRLHPGQPAAHAARHRAARRRAGPDRRRHRLHEDRARAGRPLRARPPLRAARHRRLRPLRHPRGAAPVLRDRRRRTSWSPCSPRLAAQGEVKPEAVDRRHRPLRHRPRRRPTPRPGR